MKRIISASRRTDIPAFYGDWFMNRLKEGFVGYVNPFGGQKYIVSLKPDDVLCFVFWSKNFEPFIKKLKAMESKGYKFYFNYTITGLPNIFECNVVERARAISALKELCRMYSPKHINWRYDPIIISDITDYDFHVENFEGIASALEGYVERCYFSYAVRYGKVERNFGRFQKKHDVEIIDPSNGLKIKLANKLSNIAEQYKIEMLSCCSDCFLSPNIGKAHCIDGRIIEDLFFKNGFKYGEKPSRKECGCTKSTDVGSYDTCPHACIYCYANINKKRANSRFENRDENASFLGYTKEKSDRWISDVKRKENEKNNSDQMKLS